MAVDEGNATFKWTGNGWQSLHSKACCSFSPAPLAYDYGAHRMLRFAHEVYTWSGSGWDRLPVPGPTELGPTEVLVGIVYDIAAKQFVGVSVFGDTVTFDGAEWVGTGALPMFPRLMGGNIAALVYDPVREKVVAVGRDHFDSGQFYLATWDGNQWTTSVAVLPSDLADGASALGFDPARDVVLFGGSRHLWTWNGTDFAQAPDGDIPDGLAAAAFDEDSGQLLSVQETLVQCAPGS